MLTIFRVLEHNHLERKNGSFVENDCLVVIDGLTRTTGSKSQRDPFLPANLQAVPYHARRLKHNGRTES